MICPNCQNEIQAEAKFCNKCGFRLPETPQVPETKAAISEPVCRKCGAKLKPDAKFCEDCGTVVNTVVNKEVKPVITEDVKIYNTSKKKKGGAETIVVIFFVTLIAIVGTAGILMWQGIIPAPAMIAEKADKISEEPFAEKDTETSTRTEPDTLENPETANPDIDTDALFAETDSLVETAKSRMDTDAEIINVMGSLSSAVRTYGSKAEEVGDAAVASDRIRDAYEAYIKAVNRHKNMMNASALSGAIYAQIMSELDEAVALGDEMAQKGYETDTFDLEIERKVFDESYRERMIDTFDEFTTREAWSRTEAWNLMRDTADNMFDPSDLDNPLRLRYCYALAWWTQKQIETELASGTITQKGAAIKIADLIEAMDYNPMMIDYYIQYMSASGEDCQDVAEAYDEIVRRIAETQGIELGSEIDLAHFWYFNDSPAPAAGVQDGSVNGVTPENREWIRNRMKSVSFKE